MSIYFWLLLLIFILLFILFFYYGYMYNLIIASRLTNTTGLIGVEKVFDNVDALENGEIISSISDLAPKANTVLVKIENRNLIKLTLKPITIKNFSKKIILPITIAGNSMNAVIDSTSKYSYCPAFFSDKTQSGDSSIKLSTSDKKKYNEGAYFSIKIGNVEVYHLFYFSNSNSENVILGMDFADILEKNGILLTPKSGLDGLQLNPEHLPLPDCRFEPNYLYEFAKIFNHCSDFLTVSSEEGEKSGQNEKTKDAEIIEKRKKNVDKMGKLRLMLFSDDQNASLYSIGDVLVVNFDSELRSSHSNQSALFEIEGVSISNYEQLFFTTPTYFIKGFAYKNQIANDM